MPSLKSPEPFYGNWADHMNRMAQETGREIHEPLVENRNCDCTRQLVGSVFCGIFCLPCACTRLIGSCTGGISPERVTTIPGLECCSSAKLCEGARGYEYADYTEGQRSGSGFSRRVLDIINVIVTPVIWGAATTYAVLHQE